MKERILEFLKAENKSSAQFAEDIGVQPSGISHILSGRNNPSLDFILKMLEKYQFLSTEWLLFGKGTMYKDSRMQSLFDEEQASKRDFSEKAINNEKVNAEIEFQSITETDNVKDSLIHTKDKASTIVRIVWFYDNNSFEEYYPTR